MNQYNGYTRETPEHVRRELWAMARRCATLLDAWQQAEATPVRWRRGDAPLLRDLIERIEADEAQLLSRDQYIRLGIRNPIEAGHWAPHDLT
jgi:hypothetical protein